MCTADRQLHLLRTRLCSICHIFDFNACHPRVRGVLDSRSCFDCVHEPYVCSRLCSLLIGRVLRANVDSKRSLRPYPSKLRMLWYAMAILMKSAHSHASGIHMVAARSWSCSGSNQWMSQHMHEWLWTVPTRAWLTTTRSNGAPI